LDALGRNKMRVVPGISAKVMSVANQYVPRSIVAPIVGTAYKKLGGGELTTGADAKDATGDSAAGCATGYA